MKNILKSLCLLAILPVSALFAQNERTSVHRNLKLAFEFGVNVMSCELAKPEQIRENHYLRYYYRDSYYSDYGSFGDYGNLQTLNFGVKPEIFVFYNRIGIASGLRFTYVETKLSSDRSDYLWKLREDGLNTYYVQIKDIRQKNYLLGIPLEVRFFPNKRELPFQQYVKLGASFNYRIHHDTKVNFARFTMEKYNDEVHNQLPDINNTFSAFVFGAVGFKIGRYKEGKMKPWGNIEFQFPYVMVTKNTFAFAGRYDIDEFPGVGFQMSLQIPIGKNVPIGSKKTI